MCGHLVIGARGGWDTHGLPVEVEVEKELGFQGKTDIEKYGIEAFNRACKESVKRYVDAFEEMTERIGYWLDLEDPYRTYDNSYIESLWWITKQLWERDLLFRDYKVTMHCPRCGTTLADAEVALGFEDDVDDPSVWVKFRRSANPASAGRAPVRRVVCRMDHDAVDAAGQCGAGGQAGGANMCWPSIDGERYVLAGALLEPVLGERAEVLDSFTGRELVGVHYERPVRGGSGSGRYCRLANRVSRGSRRFRVAGRRHRDRTYRAGLWRP